MTFEFQKIEKKWQQYWEENNTFKCDTYDNSKPKCYILDMFPYPSGNGLHVGHPEGYTATDIVSRVKRMQGYNVLHPMGWDSFGLPAEQYAIRTGNHPETFTLENIKNFKRQLKELGFSYDWEREIATSSVDYYKWTQWIFTKLYEKGLAYVDEIPVNWCEALQTVLANEEVIDGKSEIGGHPVVRKPMRQWVLKITEYAERLLEDLELCDWPSSTKEMQINWIGKSVGADVVFNVADTDLSFTVFTTRCDTLFGATYCVLAPEHPFVDQIATSENKEAIEAYRREIASKSDLERTELNKNKTGIFTGAYAINPVTNKKIPIWISDYVLASYGHGAIMAVPAHDQRDYEFAKKFGLEIIAVLDGDVREKAFEEDALHINSDFLNGLDKQTAIDKMIAYLEENNIGKAKTTYKLRDWLFSRQRYWGEPIPVVHFEDGSMRALSLEELPVELPATTNFKTANNGESPLANIDSFINIEIDGKKARRETNTMPQWAGSCWYYLRYIDPHNADMIADPKLLEKWLPVDLYIGGAEHAVLHLLYARFWHKVLYDCGVVTTKEPFQKLFHQGMILGENNIKMSKSRGNVVPTDEVVATHGADALRVYEMFMGPLEATLAWSPNGLDGAKKWLERVYRLIIEEQKISEENDGKLDYIYNYTVKKVTDDIASLNFNTAISQMMIFINECYKAETIYREYVLGFIKLLYPFAPHLGEELWQLMGYRDTITYESWPIYDEAKLVKDEVEIVVQINGKLKAKFNFKSNAEDAEIQSAALSNEKVVEALANQTVKKVIVVKKKLVNIVI